MKTILRIFIFLLGTYFASAQTVSWSQNSPDTYGFPYQAIATDSHGNMYTLCTYDGSVTDFDPGSGVFNMSAFSQNMYLQKLDSDGNFLWAKQIGGPAYSNNTGLTLAIDSSDNVYFCGNVSVYYGSIDMDPGSGVYPLTGNFSYFEKLDSDGNFIWVKKFNAAFLSLKIDKDNNIYATGSFSGTINFDPDGGVTNLTGPGSFVLKLNTSGSLIWAKVLTGGIGYSIDVDNAGNVYTVGYYNTTMDMDPGTGVHTINVFTSDNPVQSGFGSIYVSKLDKDGNFVWGYGLNGDHNNQWHPAIAVDQNANVIISGYAESPTVVDFDFGAGTFYLPNTSGAFLLKIDKDANFIWAKSLAEETINPRAQSYGNGVVLDSFGNIYSICSFLGTCDVDPSATAKIFTSSSVDTYVSKLDNDGNFIWAQQFGGSGIDEAFSLAISPQGKVYVRGHTSAGAFNKSTSALAAGGFVASVTQPALTTSQFNLNKNISVYPNPSLGTFNIEIDENLIGSKATIYNLLGQKVKDFSLNATNTTQNLNHGNYLVEIEKDGNITTKKLIVN
jgi:hypothetical protein